MHRFVALLRGVNVGKGPRVQMAALRRLLEALGYTGVRTLLNSGNAVFDSSGRSATAHAQAIEGALREDMNLQVQVVVKSSADFLAAIADNRLARGEFEPARLLVAFTQTQQVLKDLSALQPGSCPPSAFTLA